MDIGYIISDEKVVSQNELFNLDKIPEQDYILLFSRILDEQIIVCKNKKLLGELKSEYPDVVIYFLQELREIERLWNGYKKVKDKNDFIKKVHMTKKEFGAWVKPR